MKTSSDRASAQIYQFPARGRFAASIARDETPAAKPGSPQAVKAAGGSGWYHEAAIEDAERARSN
jgi:hypothetical protein